MTRTARINALLAVTILLAPAEAAARHWEDGSCTYSLADVVHPPRFEDYPATRPPVARSVAPRLVGADARRFRTRLRIGAARGPAFAGPYRIAAWGCGMVCTDWAIVDARTGRISYLDGLSTISGDHVDGYTLVFRPDSRLLVVLGGSGNDEVRDGARFLDWTGSRFRRLRYVPMAAICGAPPAPRG